MKDVNQLVARPYRTGSSHDPVDMATRVLAFLAADPDRLSRFFALTGLDAASTRQAAAEASFARSVLGYLSEDEGLLVAFAAAENLRPEHVAASIRSAVGPTDW